jgi:putative hemolysin
VVRRQSSRRFEVVIAQQPVQALAAHHFTGRTSGLFAWLNQPVAESLMASLGMKMLNERTCRSLQRPLSEEDRPFPGTPP